MGMPGLHPGLFGEVHWTGGEAMTALMSVDLGIRVSTSDASAEADRRTPEELARVAAAARERLDGAPAEAVIEWAVAEFGPRFCVTSSFADAVLAHIAGRVAPGVDVVFLDTGLHFPQTL